MAQSKQLLGVQVTLMLKSGNITIACSEWCVVNYLNHLRQSWVFAAMMMLK